MTGYTAPQFIIDDGKPVAGELIREHETEVVESRGATAPDPAWRTVDAAGHFHAYNRDLTLPTLTARRRHIPCDGEHPGYAFYGVAEPEHPAPCDGSEVTEYFCLICDEQITPGRAPQLRTEIDLGEHWTVIVPRHIGDRARVSVRIEQAGVVLFGFAVRTGQQRSRGGQVETQLTGITPLAEMPARVPEQGRSR